jgi:3-oxoacyl-[acyl-carrier-protein] synthase II
MRHPAVAITGVGVASPLGSDAQVFATRIFDGEVAVRPVTRFDPARFRCRLAAEVDDRGLVKAPAADPFARRLGRFVHLALAATADALVDAELHPMATESPQAVAKDVGRGGVFAGVAVGGLPEMEQGVLRQEQRGPRKIFPFLIPSLIPNMAASQIAEHYAPGVPQWTLAGACASGTQALIEAAHAIASGRLDWAIAGGSEAVITPITFSGFEAMLSLSVRAEGTPRPFDRAADGMIVGEGAAFFVLESRAHAAARGARVRGAIAGGAITSGAERLTLSSVSAAVRCMRMALADAAVQTDEIDCVFAQATGLPAGDAQEMAALVDVFRGGARPVITSVKGQIGHTFGASGPLHVAVALESMRRQRVPRVVNLDEPAPVGASLDLARDVCDRRIRGVLVNSFGFGGLNATIVLTSSDSDGEPRHEEQGAVDT